MKYQYINDGYNRIHKLEFSGLSDILSYVRSDPRVNRTAFMTQSSLNDDTSFYGVPLNEIIDICEKGSSEGIEKFLELKKEIDTITSLTPQRRKIVTDVVGYAPNMSKVLTGNPKNMYRLQRKNIKKNITVHFNLGYPSATSKESILNRGILTLNLIDYLKSRDYLVNFQTFFCSCIFNEYIYIITNLNFSEKLCYAPLCNRAFLRRIIFRIMESTNVSNANWESSYGSPLSKKEIINLFNIPTNDIIIGYPGELKIQGYNIYLDAENFFNELNLIDNIDFSKIKKKTR